MVPLQRESSAKIDVLLGDAIEWLPEVALRWIRVSSNGLVAGFTILRLFCTLEPFLMPRSVLS